MEKVEEQWNKMTYYYRELALILKNPPLQSKPRISLKISPACTKARCG